MPPKKKWREMSLSELTHCPGYFGKFSFEHAYVRDDDTGKWLLGHNVYRYGGATPGMGWVTGGFWELWFWGMETLLAEYEFNARNKLIPPTTWANKQISQYLIEIPY